MHYAYFGLAEDPFAVQRSTPQFVATPGHDEALARLEYLAESPGSGGLLLGGAGLGKSLLLHVFAERMRRRSAAVALVSGRSLDGHSLLASLAQQWGVSSCRPLPPESLGVAVANRLQELAIESAATILIVDDAEQSSNEIIRTLGGVLSARGASSVITIAGAADAQGVESSLRQRVELQIELPIWDEVDVRQYLSERLARCGGDSDIFDDLSVAALTAHAAGVPRRVAQLARLALVAAAAKRQRTVDAQTIDEVERELCPQMEAGVVAYT